MKKKLNCVLLVDDDDGTNFINRKIIEKAGIAEYIHTSLNGKEAIDYLSKVSNEGIYPQPDLILLDINMPVMDGWEFVEAYENLKIGQKGKIIIVMLTTSLNPDDKKKADHYNAISDFEFKPLTLKKLEEIIKKHF
jgi:CheY-like chemotaxis protein